MVWNTYLVVAIPKVADSQAKSRHHFCYKYELKNVLKNIICLKLIFTPIIGSKPHRYTYQMKALKA